MFLWLRPSFTHTEVIQIALDDFHRLPTACTAILHSFLEDGEYSRLGEEEVRRQAEAAAVLTVESAPWLERRRSGELPLAWRGI